MDIAPVVVEVEVGLVPSLRLLRQLAQAVQITARPGLDHIGQHPGDAFADAFDRGQLLGAMELGQVGPLKRERPGGRGERLGTKPLLGVLPEQVADLGQNLRRFDRFQPVNCVSKHGCAEAEAG